MTDIITLAKYKAHEGLTKNDQDAKLTLLISAASSIIKTYVGGIFAPSGTAPIEEYFNIDYDTDTLWPQYTPIQNVLLIEEKDRYTQDSTVHVPLQSGTEYQVLTDRIIRIPGSGGFGKWPQGPASVKVTYFGGYTSDSTPRDLELACIELVNYYRDKGFLPNRSLQGATIITAGAAQPELPAHVRAILNLYRNY